MKKINNEQNVDSLNVSHDVIKPMLYAVEDVIFFRYKGGRFVKGKVLRVDNKGILLKLKTDYIGKNDEWFTGEDKYFNKAEMKNIRKQ